MTEKFKTKYHALAWAAEDENNVFVDGDNYHVKMVNETIMANEDGDSHWFECDASFLITEPCHKLEVEKSNKEFVKNFYKYIGFNVSIIEDILDECDKRYARKR